MNQDLSLSLQTLLPELATDTSNKYNDNDLPWDMMIAYPHPTLDDKIISAAADMPHAVKKQVNAIELSSKKKPKRDLHLNGLPVQLRMGHDAYKESTDSTSEGAITIYRSLGIDVFEKNIEVKNEFCISRSRGWQYLGPLYSGK